MGIFSYSGCMRQIMWSSMATPPNRQIVTQCFWLKDFKSNNYFCVIMNHFPCLQSLCGNARANEVKQINNQPTLEYMQLSFNSLKMSFAKHTVKMSLLFAKQNISHSPSSLHCSLYGPLKSRLQNSPSGLPQSPNLD